MMVDSRNIATVLIVSGDLEATRQITDVLQQQALSVEFSIDTSVALEKLSQRKYEALLIDLSLGAKALHFHRQVRNSASNRTAITFALTTSREETAFALKQGFSFALERPLIAESVAHTLKVAYGLIVRERRRYFRCSVAVPAVLSRKAAPEVYAQTINVSEGGLALRSSTILASSLEATIEFTLTDPKLHIKAYSRVCWHNEKGEAGLSFILMPLEMASGLQQWLALKLEKQLPVSVADRFRIPIRQ